MSSPQQQQRRRRQRRSAASAVVTTAATAAAAYGTYRLAKWYWNEDEESQEGVEHPLEEDLPSFSAEERARGDTTNRNQDKTSSKPRSDENNESNFSWLSTAAVGVANWLIDDNNVFPGVRGGLRDDQTEFAPRPKLTRRQNLIRCRSQARVAFHTCFQTAKPVLENLTDSSRQTKELKALRKRKQALKQGGQDDDSEEKKEVCNKTLTMDQEQQEGEIRFLEAQEEELWREILVETTTRMMASSYAYALLLLSLTVQFHWLASTAASHLDSSEEQERKQEALLMQSHQYFLNEGIPLLVSTVRRAVEKVVFGDDEDEESVLDRAGYSSQWRNPSSQFVSSKDVEQTLYRKLPRILDDIGMGSGRSRRRRRNWIRFVLPDEEVFDPVWDICRSPVWEDAQDQLLSYLWYKILRDGQSCSDSNDCDNTRGWGRLFRTNGKTSSTHLKSSGMLRPNQNHLHTKYGQPLAKVMGHFKKAASALFEEPPNGNDGGSTSTTKNLQRSRESTLVRRLQTLPTVLELGDITFI